MAIAGASRFALSAQLANTRGLAAQPSTLLSGFDGGPSSLLEIGKQFSAPGIGLSARARAVTSQFLAESQGGINIILSAGAQATIDGTLTQIKAIQSKLPASQIGPFSKTTDDNADDGGLSTALNGNVVDTEA